MSASSAEMISYLYNLASKALTGDKEQRVINRFLSKGVPFKNIPDYLHAYKMAIVHKTLAETETALAPSGGIAIENTKP
jgi:hypothetical protein